MKRRTWIGFIPILGITAITELSLFAALWCSNRPVEPTPTANLFDEPESDYKKEESWFTPDDQEDTERNDTTILFSGFKLKDNVLLSNLVATCDTGGNEWDVRLYPYPSDGLFDVFLYGHNITNAASLTTLNLTVHFQDTSTGEQQDCKNLTVEFKNDKGIATPIAPAVDSFYVHKVLNTWDDDMKQKTCMLKTVASSDEGVGWVLYLGNDYGQSSMQVCIFVNETREIVIEPKYPLTGILDKTFFDNQTSLNMDVLQVLDKSWNNCAFGQGGNERVYFISNPNI